MHTPRCSGEAISAFIRGMNWYAVLLVVVGAVVMASSAVVERDEGAGNAGHIVLLGSSIALVGIFWLF